jgi:hypothetical protein
MVLFKHRGPTHWISTSALISALVTATAIAIAPATAFPVGVGSRMRVCAAHARRRLHAVRQPAAGTVREAERPPAAPRLLIHTGGPADIIVGVATMCLAGGFLTLAV